MSDISLRSLRPFECAFTEPMINEDYLREVKLGQLKTIKRITRFKIIFSLIITGRIKYCAYDRVAELWNARANEANDV